MSKKKYQFDKRRRNAPFCPCGKDNRRGDFFSPILGYTDKGKCFKCKRFFHPDKANLKISMHEKAPVVEENKPVEITPISYIPIDVFNRSFGSYDKNTFVNFMANLTDSDTALKLIKTYCLGTSLFWPGSIVFWLIDYDSKIRSGKIIQYKICLDEKSVIGTNCKRVKGNKPPTKWVHKLAQYKDFNLVQCFFGEHLLSKHPDKPIGILESEKSAIIAAAYMPEFLWLACGGSGGLSKNLEVLRGRRIILFPDLKQHSEWQKQAVKMRTALKGTTITVSDLLEKKATPEEWAAGLDLADYLIREKWTNRK